MSNCQYFIKTLIRIYYCITPALLFYLVEIKKIIGVTNLVLIMSCIDFHKYPFFFKSTEITTSMTPTKNELKTTQLVQIFSYDKTAQLHSFKKDYHKDKTVHIRDRKSVV